MDNIRLDALAESGDLNQWTEIEVRETVLRQAAGYLRKKYGVTNRAAGDLVRLAELEAQGNSALKEN